MPDRVLAAEGLTREEAMRALHNAINVEGLPLDARYRMVDTFVAALASGDPSPSLPAEPSEEAIEAAAQTLAKGHGWSLMEAEDWEKELALSYRTEARAALRAAYEVDGSVAPDEEET